MKHIDITKVRFCARPGDKDNPSFLHDKGITLLFHDKSINDPFSREKVKTIFLTREKYKRFFFHDNATGLRRL